MKNTLLAAFSFYFFVSNIPPVFAFVCSGNYSRTSCTSRLPIPTPLETGSDNSVRPAHTKLIDSATGSPDCARCSDHAGGSPARR